MRTVRNLKIKSGLSKISLLHCLRLGIRALLLFSALLYYLFEENRSEITADGFIKAHPFICIVVFIMPTAEIIARFFPSSMESMGCQKYLASNYIPTKGADIRAKDRGTLAIAIVWIGANAAIGALYKAGIIDEWLVVMLFLAYSVGDMICVLVICPFQWIMRNRCCVSCRIYNWDYAMMCTPLMIIGGSPYIIILSILSLILLIRWEIAYIRHPNRFFPETNAALSCDRCEEKICQHKRQIYR